jgi:hypothetical protein
MLMVLLARRSLLPLLLQLAAAPALPHQHSQQALLQ